VFSSSSTTNVAVVVVVVDIHMHLQLKKVTRFVIERGRQRHMSGLVNDDASSAI
jgi:hypothetical protein